MIAVIIGPIAALLVIGLIVLIRAFSNKKQQAQTQEKKVRLLIHSINDDRCTGCDACVTVCPTEVLELRSNKSRVIRFEDCIQCEQCMHVCPTNALVMHHEGQKPPPVMVPDLDEYYQARVPGLYLLGEVAGKPLVKNAVNLGRAAIEHALRNGLSPGALDRFTTVDPTTTYVDVIIVGSGPAGLSAAMSCLERKLSYVVLEKDALVASTIARYPKGKKVMAEPYDVRCVGLLPVWDATKDQTILEWNRILTEVALDIKLREVVEDVRRDEHGFWVKTDQGAYRGQRVLLGIGTRGKPRKLGVPGEDLPHVAPLLDDPDLYQQKTLLVVGGGDSAVEAALALSEPSLRSKVVLSYRGKKFNKVKAKNRQDLDAAVERGRVLLLLGSNVLKFSEKTTAMKLGDGREKTIPTDNAFVLIGGDPPVKWLESIGITYAQRPHEFTLGPTHELVERLLGKQRDNNRPGLPVPAALRVQNSLGEEDNAATVMQDQATTMEAIRKAMAGGTMRRRGGAAMTIMVPKDQFLLQLPDRLQVDGSESKVKTMRGAIPR